MRINASFTLNPETVWRECSNEKNSHPHADWFPDEGGGKHSSLLCPVFSLTGFHSDQMATLKPFNDLRGSPLLAHLLGSISPPGWVLLLVRRSHTEARSIRFVFIHPSGSSLGLHVVSVHSAWPAERPLLSKEPQCTRPLLHSFMPQIKLRSFRWMEPSALFGPDKCVLWVRNSLVNTTRAGWTCCFYAHFSS